MRTQCHNVNYLVKYEVIFAYADIFDMSLQEVLLYFYIKIIRNVSVITHVILINEGLQDKQPVDTVL